MKIISDCISILDIYIRDFLSTKSCEFANYVSCRRIPSIEVIKNNKKEKN